ncbi:MAG: ROK family transcriptional regulator [Thermotoga caldifontis]|uniref:ROK family transcriptional regulator n=1 Tax=Thermotoga caldifontis TaxID=1508419 RepID=UPI003C7D8A80
MLTELEATILRLIRDNPGISRLDIARKLSISKPLVTNVVARLIKRGLVVESGTRKTPAGRPKVSLKFVPDAWYCVGIELEERYFELIVTDLSGRIVHSEQEKIDSLGKDRLIDLCQERVERSLEKNSLPKEKILGVGIGIAGMVDPTSRVVRTAPALGLTNFDLASVLAERLNLNVIVVNRVKAAALAEHRVGAAKDAQNVLFVFVDSGLGSAVLLNGKIYEGFYGKAGEFGWMVTDLDRSEPELCEIEDFGHLARRFSGHAITIRLKDANVNVEDIFDGQIDGEFEHLLISGLRHIAAALANAILLFDPQQIVIKGRIGHKHYERIVELMMPTLKQILPPQFHENLNLHKGLIEDFDVALGAVFAVQQRFMGL